MRLVARRKAYLQTWGCQMNRQEGAVLAGLLARAGFERTRLPAEADVLVLETCAIRSKAEEKVWSALGSLRHEARAAGRDPRIVVAGCVAQTESDRLVRRFGVDLVLGPRRIARLADLLPRVMEGEGPIVETGGDWVLPPEDVTAPDVPGVSAYVSVMQGCSNACAFCVVPSRRGTATSRDSASILAEVLRLEDDGTREVTLLGQNISYWGLDRTDGERLADLLGLLHARTTIPRIRFATSHPLYLDDRFVSAFADLPRVMPHLHVPAQSGSDRILRAMRRGYTSSHYLDLVGRVRAARPGAAVTTDLISGFPGETDADHRATLALCEAANFDQAYVYAYSERPGTSAAGAAETVDPDLRTRRMREIYDCVSRKMASANRARVGSVVEVLVEGPDERGTGTRGRSPENRAVVLDGGLPGEIVRARVTDATTASLRAARVRERPVGAAPVGTA